MKKIFLIAVVVCFQMSVSAQIIRAKETPQPPPSKSKTAKAPEKPQKPEPPKPIIIPTPEFINQPYYYDAGDNKLIKLESTSAQLITKKKTLGLQGSKQSLMMTYPSSKVRFTARDSITFMIKTSGDVIDLTTYIKLYKFVSADEKREVNISTKEGMLNDKDNQKGKSISFSVKMISPDNYMVQFSNALEAGEYGFVWLKNMELKECNVFAFGIDWKNSD
ncbi:MAG TPA: hypothetical protein VEV87_02185 [Chitinophagaceae bacterium]|nr:hypothetical protein [Chitinophagaceae bacterium]